MPGMGTDRVIQRSWVRLPEIMLIEGTSWINHDPIGYNISSYLAEWVRVGTSVGTRQGYEMEWYKESRTGYELTII